MENRWRSISGRTKRKMTTAERTGSVYSTARLDLWMQLAVQERGTPRMPGGPRAERGMPLSKAMIPSRDSSSLRLLRPRNGPSIRAAERAPTRKYRSPSISLARANEVRGSGPLATTLRGFRSISKPGLDSLSLSLSFPFFPPPSGERKEKIFHRSEDGNGRFRVRETRAFRRQASRDRSSRH